MWREKFIFEQNHPQVPHVSVTNFKSRGRWKESHFCICINEHSEEEPKSGIVPRALESSLRSWSFLQTVVPTLQTPMACVYDRSIVA